MNACLRMSARRQLRGLMLLAFAVLLFSILRDGCSRVFTAGMVETVVSANLRADR